MNENVEQIRKSVNWGGRVKRLNLLVVMALMLSLLMPAATPLAQQAARVQPLLLDMAAQQPDQVVSVIVQKSVQDDRVEQAVGALGGTVTKDLHIINAFAAEMKAKDVLQLARTGGVKWVSLDAAVRSTAGGSINIRVAASSDDAEENGSDATAVQGPGYMWLDSTDLEMTEDYHLDGAYMGHQKLGMRFTNVAVPRGATITVAYLRFKAIAPDAGNSNTNTVKLTVQGQAADNAATFTTSLNNISGRPRTAAEVQWIPEAWTDGMVYDTPSLAAVVQEIVNRPGWASGNSMVYIIRCTDGMPAGECGSRSADSWDGNAATAPELHIEWTDGTGSPASNVILRENFEDDLAKGANWPSDEDWSGSGWTEIGESNGVRNGDVTIADFTSGSRRGLRLQNPNKGLQDSVDLSNASSATLSLGYRRKSLDDVNDYVALQISANGGANWVELTRLAGPGTDDDLQLISFDITAYRSSNIAIRFLSSNSLGSKDRVFIDYVEIEYPPISGGAPPPPISNFTVRDEFNITDYSHDDGTGTWLGAWTEVGDDGSPGSGAITVEADSNCPNDGRCLELDASSGRSISRAVDLSDADSATLSYAYNWDHGEGGAVVVEASSDGSTWTPLMPYASSASGSEQFDLTPYKSATTHIRFRVTSSGEGSHLWVDDVQIEAADNTYDSTGVGGKVLDQFGAVSYSNNNGTQNWSNSWTETGDGTTSPSAGYVRVSGGALYLKYTNRAISRGVNLTGAMTATLSLKYKRSALDNASDYVALQVSANGGSTWTEIDRFAGPTNDASYQPRSYDISAYIAANTAIRFVTSSALGSSDIVYFDDVQIEHACAECISTGGLASNFVKTIGADKLWNGSKHLKGKDVTVAVVDSGIAKHDDLKDKKKDDASRVLKRAEFGGSQTAVDDKNGHGTHIAGIIGGGGLKSDGAYLGVAPEVDLVDVKVADDQGMSTMSDVVAGLQWILEHKDEYNIRVVNLSLNSTVAESYHTSPLDAAVEILWFNGIVVVVAAGNNGAAGLFPPANDPFVIVVGAADEMGTASLSDDVVASFSAYGVTVDGFAKPDLVAPGRNIVSLLASEDSNFALDHPSNAMTGADGLSYFKMSGTSAAAPIVAGAVALLLEDEPGLNPDQVKYRLMATANKSWPGYNATTAGAGYLDVYAAVNGTTTQTANTGTTASQLLWTGSEPVNWGSVQWGSVQWGSVQWGSVQWGSVQWGSVQWGSDYWGP